MSEDNQTINLEPDTVTGEGKYQKLPINPSHHEDKIDDLWLSQEKQRKEHTNEPYFVVDKTQNFSLAQNFEVIVHFVFIIFIIYNKINSNHKHLLKFQI